MYYIHIHEFTYSRIHAYVRPGRTRSMSIDRLGYAERTTYSPPVGSASTARHREAKGKVAPLQKAPLTNPSTKVDEDARPTLPPPTKPPAASSRPLPKSSEQHSSGARRAKPRQGQGQGQGQGHGQGQGQGPSRETSTMWAGAGRGKVRICCGTSAMPTTLYCIYVLAIGFGHCCHPSEMVSMVASAV